MYDIFEDAKRINFFGKILIIISNNKIVFKDLNEPNTHHTIMFLDNGVIDIHKTKEGKLKEYESISQFNFGNVMKEMLNVFDNKEENIFNDMLQELKPVNFTEKEFENYHIILNNTKQEFAKIIQHTKRKIAIPEERHF